MNRENPPIRFTWGGIARGYAKTLPIAAGVAVFGVAYGLIAGQHGLSLAETVLMSALVFAGSSQMLALQLWGDPLPIAGIVAAAAIINLRYVIMTAALKPWLGPLGRLLSYGSVFFTADENWAVSIAEMRAGGRDAGFFVGSGLALWSFWVVSGFIGRAFGGALPAPERLGLDFIGTAVFTALAGRMWRGRRDLWPWLASGAAAVLGAHFLPGAWYLLAGGLTGSLVGAWRDTRRTAEESYAHGA
ncbi:branched-chain amino acid ABC transporter permease [Aliidongia dinghuensis]|uniref:Branched-chain amino acid ABC transporter permease n=1 Tax=Aliidongia dinghuensis TaxID=1867774 RepID=A0A8J2YUT9_9PROT|nr:AzlC family ABC transporter permease [Aliidongia dinghuensis]GGF18002.1 branched-chain amino acid ABC transporter permease [Aliidongia dinghuensis]